MDCAINNDIFTIWLIQYGGWALFFLLAIGIIALPVPEETLMVFTGIVMHSGNLPIPSTMLAAYAGSICGISMSYLLGRTAGVYCLQKYGSWVGLTEQRLEKAHTWFEHYGKWTLLIGYFIPGVRHFTGLSAGTTNLEYKQFAIYAYTGAIIWVSTFLSIGYFFGSYCLSALKNIELETEEIILATVTAAVIGYLIYLYRKK